MKISYNWLKTLIDIDLTPEQVDEYLTSSGLEVEGIEAFESVKGGLNGIVIGEVVEKEKHPDADKLSVTKVNVGAAELLNIVCGAPNVAAGQKVLVAMIGAKLYPTTGEPFEIKKSIYVYTMSNYFKTCNQPKKLSEILFFIFFKKLDGYLVPGTTLFCKKILFEGKKILDNK